MKGGDDQRPFVVEVVAEQPHGNVGLPGNVAHACAVQAISDNALHGGVEYLFLGFGEGLRSHLVMSTAVAELSYTLVT